MAERPSGPAKYGLFEKDAHGGVTRLESTAYGRKEAKILAAAIRRTGRSVYARRVRA